METPTPRTSAAAYFLEGRTVVNAHVSHQLEAELTAALARIAELERESRDVPLCAHHAEVWFCERHFKPGDCWFCQQNNQIDSITRQLSESQAQLASAREDEKLYRELEISITDVQDWSGTRVGDALDAIDSARGATSPPAVAETGEKDAWQDIATAPKDGTRVLLWGVNHPGEAYHCIEAWFDKEWWGTFGNDDVHNVSHWQPLPPPPQGK